ncbi:glutamine synthetase family protein [Caulobacter sp. KR2-114]|uniref:glutamine synthetase family protein n=1 Tax=Caulobacter sp. KR2-114 TaxID=3400912 RepID=UPI003C0AC39A
MDMTSNVEEQLKNSVADTLVQFGLSDVNTIIVAATDMQGRLVGKRLTSSHFKEVGHTGINACDYLLAADIEMTPIPGFSGASWDRGYGDIVLRPDLSTLRPVPWLEKTAIVLCDMVDEDGDDLPQSPRTVLKCQINALEALGYRAFAGSEVEFYLFDEDDGGNLPRPVGKYSEDYQLYPTSRDEPLLGRAMRILNEMRIPVEGCKGEWGPGQVEVNLAFASALEMADRHVLYKFALKDIARAQGKRASFMAKWAEDAAGSGFHVHLSLEALHSKESVFAKAREGREMSDVFKQFLAGELALAAQSTLFFAPNINSYKRFQAGSFAPTSIAWGRDNRTTGFRVVGQGGSLRLECRIPGADANPYLTFAALIGAGLFGVRQCMTLGPPCVGNSYESASVRVPTSLSEAVSLCEKSQNMRDIFTSDVIDHYVHAANWEIKQASIAVTDWERRRYLERV